MRSRICADYRALWWLVEQQHLAPELVANLIEELAKEVIESFLSVQEGSYELIEKEKFDEFPIFYRLDLRPLVEFCQERLRQQRAARPSLPTPTKRPDFESQAKVLQPPTAPDMLANQATSTTATTFNNRAKSSENTSLKARVLRSFVSTIVPPYCRLLIAFWMIQVFPS